MSQFSKATARAMRVGGRNHPKPMELARRAKPIKAPHDRRKRHLNLLASGILPCGPKDLAYKRSW